MKHTISVTVENSSIRVDPDPLHMALEDEVEWAGRNARRFSIEFDDARAFGARLGYAEATTKRRPRAKGIFKYTVVSEENPGLRLDPAVVVDPPPTPPG